MFGMIRCEKPGPDDRGPCYRPIGHPGPCQYHEPLTLAELLSMRGGVTVERDADGKPTAIVLGSSLNR